MTTEQSVTQPGSASPVPTQIRHPSHLFLQKPQLVNTIASGAHFGGVLSPTSSISQRPLSPKRTRSKSREIDPFMEDEFKEVMDDLKELFCGRPTMEILRRRWREDAVLDSPLAKCIGFREIAHQWFALAKLSSDLERISTRIISATHDPNRLIYSQRHAYTMRWTGIHRIIDSIVLVELDDDFKIIRLVDQWDGELPSTGWASTFLKRASATLVPLFIRLPKDS